MVILDEHRERASAHFREQSRLLQDELDAIRSSWSYRLTAPIRLVERLVSSLRKRSLRANVKKLGGEKN
jgi:hypothetical protein